MSREIRTKPASRTPRELARRGVDGARERLAGQEVDTQDSAPENYAAGKAENEMDAAVHRGGDAALDTAGSVTDRVGRRIKEGGQPADAPSKSPVEQARRQASESGKRRVQQMARERRALRGADSAASATKASSKGTVKTAQRSVKQGHQVIKATGRSVKTAQKSAKATAKTAKQTARAARQAAKAGAKAAAQAAKAVAKATVSAVKLAAAALKSLAVAIAAGGWVAVVIILAVCVIALVVGSVFGIFFSGEDSGSGRTMPDVVAVLTTEFYEQIETIKADNPHDVAVAEAMAINWREVLAVYAVKVATDPENGMDVASLDDAKVALLRGVLNDMVSLSYYVREETQERIVESENGEESAEEVEISVLYISLDHKGVDEMATQYGFSQQQRELLAELLSPGYDELWTALIGGPVTGGDGGILTSDPGKTPLGIFAWPLAGSWPVKSGFGYRKDPLTGETAYHGGIDIPCPEGTPILAAADGVVTIANATDAWGGSYGYYVKIRHDSTYDTLYAHCSRVAVSNGQAVVKGQVIGHVGSTGRSSGPHLHFEVYENGRGSTRWGFLGELIGYS